MSAATDIAAVKTAIEICNNSEIKREILCASGSDFSNTSKRNPQFDRKNLWNKILAKKATIILENLDIPKQLHEKEINLVFLIGKRMLTWAKYHERIIGVSRECSLNFFNNSIFTERGIIDDKKAAEQLMKSEHLNIAQKFKLACHNCSTDHIPALYKQMSKEEKEKFYDADAPERIEQPELVKLWTYYLKGEVDKLWFEKSRLDQYRLEKAVRSGSKLAVEYCLEKTKLRFKKDTIVDAAVEAVRCISEANSEAKEASRNPRYTGRKESWAPTTYYVDIVYFLLSKMGDEQQIEFLKQDIEGAKYKREDDANPKHSRVLRYFLDWPYLDYFMETAKLMWEFLPERDYAELLLLICDKIHPTKNDYNKELFREFWCQSPERYKRFVFSNQRVYCSTRGELLIKAGIDLVRKLLTLINFAYENAEILKLILASATREEKENILSSQECRNDCLQQIRDEKWETLNIFIENCTLSKEEGNNFKRQLSFSEGSKTHCIYLIKRDTWFSAESFLKWSCLPEEEINELKKQMIYSYQGKSACVGYFSRDNNFEDVDHFIRWFLSSEEVEAFKKELIFSHPGTGKCSDLVTKGQLELVSEFINFCLSSEEEVRELKKNVAYGFGSSVCKVFISDNEAEAIYDNLSGEVTGRRIRFKGGKWEEVEKFLTWCFSSEEDISDFKKNKLLEEAGREIHFNLIKSNEWEEAETFFAWLGLSAEEVKELKKNTLFSYRQASDMLLKLMYTDKEMFVDYGGNQEAIELFSRWYLTDKETVLEFNKAFRGYYQDLNKEAVLQKFDLMIEQRLTDLDEP